MGTKNKPCDEPGCNTLSWKSGKCWKHHPENIAKKSVAPLVKPAVQAARDHVTEALFGEREAVKQVIESPPVTEHEVHIVNLMDVFRQRQAAELVAFAEKIGAITDPVEKLLFTLKAVQI